MVDIIGPDTSYLVSFSPATFCPLFGPEGPAGGCFVSLLAADEEWVAALAFFDADLSEWLALAEIGGEFPIREREF